MKKLALILALFLLFLTGCRESSYNILPYQERDIEALCVINEKYTVRLTKLGEKRGLEVLSPSELFGVEIYYDTTGAFLAVGDTKIPVERGRLKGVEALLSAFSLNEEYLTGANGNDIATLEFQSQDLYYTLTLGKNRMPKFITIQGSGIDYRVEVKEIKIIEASAS